MTGDTDRRRVLDATSDGPVAADTRTDRRGLLRGTLAATAAAVGLPAFGSGAATAADDGAVIDRYSRPDRIEESVEANADLFDAVREIGFPEGVRGGGGVQVSAVGEEDRPEQRLYVETDYGTLSFVVAPEGVPLGGHAHVVTDESRMAEAPFEWPLDRGTELPDGRWLFGVDGDGWRDAGFDSPDYREVVTELCGEVSECMGPTGDQCAFINCCGKVERTGNCPDDTTEEHESCEADDPCERSCYGLGGDCVCFFWHGALC